MSSTMQALGIDRMSVPERLSLIEEIWDSIVAAQETFPIPEWHKQELDRRLAACEANPDAGSPWEEVKARLRGGR
jgi:putative addiction module component (TIGR02574 family)